MLKHCARLGKIAEQPVNAEFAVQSASVGRMDEHPGKVGRTMQEFIVGTASQPGRVGLARH